MSKTAVNYKQLCCKIFNSSLQGYNSTVQVIQFRRKNWYDIMVFIHNGLYSTTSKSKTAFQQSFSTCCR